MAESSPNEQQTEAKGVKSEGAKIDVAARLREIEEKGTPDKDATVHSEGEKDSKKDEKPKDDNSKSTQQEDGDEDDDGDEGDDADAPKHSDASLEAAKEAAERTGYQKARKEDADARKERSRIYTDALKSANGDLPNILRSVQNALNRLPELEEGQRYTEADFDPVIKSVRDALNLHVDAAMYTAGQVYEAEINRLIPDKTERESFWREAEALDPALHVSSLLDLLISKRAIASAAITEAEPDALISANPKLKAHLASEKDKSYKAGRTQGRKDPPPERRGSEQTVNSDGGLLRDKDGKIDIAANLAAIR